MRRHPENSLGACTMGILYTKLSGSKKIKHQRPHLPGNWVDLNEYGTIGKPYSRALERAIMWGCGTNREAARRLRRRTLRGMRGCVYGKLWGCVQPKTKLGQPKKKSRVSRLITPEVLGLERKSLYLWVASVVLHPNIKLD